MPELTKEEWEAIDRFIQPPFIAGETPEQYKAREKLARAALDRLKPKPSIEDLAAAWHRGEAGSARELWERLSMYPSATLINSGSGPSRYYFRGEPGPTLADAVICKEFIA